MRTTPHSLPMQGFWRTAVLLLLATSLVSLEAKPYNGFDLTDSLIPKAKIKSGGPERDGIPSINLPRFTVASRADYLKDTDRVLALELEGIAKAYPIKILDRHEIVNDSFGEQKVVVTYCPLCGSGIAFDADIDGLKTFGVSGLLYNSDVLLFDRQTESLWSQIEMKAIAGPMKGRELTPLPTRYTSWGKWKNEYPDTLVLSNQQAIYAPKVYEKETYPGYESSFKIWFPVENKSRLLKPKDRIIGIKLNGATKAYPFDRLAKVQSPISDVVGGKTIEVSFDPSSETAIIRDQSDQELPGFTMYWFAWYAFHPETDVYHPHPEE